MDGQRRRCSGDRCFFAGGLANDQRKAVGNIDPSHALGGPPRQVGQWWWKSTGLRDRPDVQIGPGQQNRPHW